MKQTLSKLSLEDARSVLAMCSGKRDETTLRILLSALNSEYWQVRKEAADLLVAIGADAAAPLKNAFMSGSEDQRYWVMNILARILGRDGLPWLGRLYKTKDPELRSFVLSAVSVIPGAEASRFLFDALSDDSWLNRVAAAGYLERRGRDVLKLLQKGFSEGSGDIKYWCLRLLVQILGKDSESILWKGLRNDDPNIRHYVIRSMEDTKGEWCHAILIEALADKNWANRKTAATILQLRGKRVVPALINCLGTNDFDVIYWTVKALSVIGDPRALAPLEELLHKYTNAQVQLWILSGLASFQNEQAARILVEASYEFPDRSSFIRDKLLEFGIRAVRPLLTYIRSPNKDLKVLARNVLLDLKLPAMGSLVKTLDNVSRAEFDSLLVEIARLTEPRLEELLSGSSVDVGLLHSFADAVDSRAVPSMNTLSLRVPVGRALSAIAPGRDGKGLDSLRTDGDEGAAADPGEKFEFRSILIGALENEASDIHFKSNLPPIFRIHGTLTQTDYPPLSPEDITDVMKVVGGSARYKVFKEKMELDLAYELEGHCRFRVNFYSELDGPGMAFRVIPGRVLSLADLRFPNVFKDICNNRQGLVIVTGPTGAGKTTTLAAMIDYINSTREEHIITIEDPVEYRHSNRKSIITYRELGKNTHSFSAALRGALRQDPDVILVGEMRDLETISLALVAAETGHLVLSTLHTTSAAETVDRILSVFPATGVEVVKKSLADSLRAIVSQILVPGVDGRRTVAMEILVKTHAVANLIRENKFNQIDQAIISGRDQGMQSRDEHLVRLVKEHAITRDTALAFCIDKNETLNKLRAV